MRLRFCHGFLVLWEIADKCGHNCGHKHLQNLDFVVKITVADHFFKTLELNLD